VVSISKRRKQFILLLICFSIIFSIVLLSQLREEKQIEEAIDVKGYKSILLYKKDYKGSRLEDWIKTCTRSGGYYQFINSDPDSWDMYIYYPEINSELKYIKYNVDFNIIDSVVKISINEEDAISDEEVIKGLVLNIKAPLRDTWPSTSEVYVNGSKIDCIGQGYQD